MDFNWEQAMRTVHAIEHCWLNIVGYNMSDVLENYVGSGLILFKIFIQSAGLNEPLLT
jgi:hypothetical protein